MLVFWKKGYHDTSIEDLVQALGINRASLYDTFGGKRQLFDLALNSYHTFNANRISEFLRSQDDAKAALSWLFRRIIEDDCLDEDRKGCFVANTTTELAPHDEEIAKIIVAHKENNEEAFFELFSRCQQAGQISADKDARALARLVYTLMQGLRTIGKTRPNKEELIAATEQVLELLD